MIVKYTRPPVRETSPTPIQRKPCSAAVRSPSASSRARPATFATVAHDNCASAATAATGNRVHRAASRSKNRRVMRKFGIAYGSRSTRVPPQQAIRSGRTSR